MSIFLRAFLTLTASALLAVGVQSQSKDLKVRIDRALKKSRRYLERDLSNTRGDPLALVCLAAANDGMGEKDAAFIKAIDRLARLDLSTTYALALRLMVIAKYRQFPNRDEVAARDTKLLLGRCSKSGAFGYSDASVGWDLSNTQYGALGLRAANALGQNIRKYVWVSLMERVAEVQGRKGGWGYSFQPDQKHLTVGETVSMTVAGIAVLEICRQHLGLTGAADARIVKQIELGWQWMEKNKGRIGRSAGPWAFYFHYGLERAAILSSRDKVGGVDWYVEGARMLLKRQKRAGWFEDISFRRSPGSDPTATAFAVLFLRRSFQRTLGRPVTGGFSYLCHALPEQATDAQVQRAVETDVKRGLSAVPDLLKGMRSSIAVRRRGCSLAISKISGKDFGFQAESSSDMNSQALRRAERWWLTEGQTRKSPPKDH